MSLNGWGGALWGELDGYLREAAPDVLCLHEVVHTSTAATDWLTYRDGDHVLPQRANLLRDVCRALPRHMATFCPAAQGVLWDGGHQLSSRWGLATFVREDLPVVAQAQGFVHKAFSPDGYGDHPRSRTAHAIRVFDLGAGGPVTIAHMHGLRDTRGKMDTPERLEQARRLARLVATVAEPGDRLVVCGDLTVEPDSQTVAVLAELGLRNLVTGRGFAGTRSSRYAKSGRFADYMLVNDAVEVTAFEVVDQPEVSDHRPLVLPI